MHNAYADIILSDVKSPIMLYKIQNFVCEETTFLLHFQVRYLYPPYGWIVILSLDSNVG